MMDNDENVRLTEIETQKLRLEIEQQKLALLQQQIALIKAMRQDLIAEEKIPRSTILSLTLSERPLVTRLTVVAFCYGLFVAAGVLFVWLSEVFSVTTAIAVLFGVVGAISTAYLRLSTNAYYELLERELLKIGKDVEDVRGQIDALE
jgi:hypothetical protein